MHRSDMGEFLIRVCEGERTVKQFAAPNALHYEGVERVLRQIFPPLQAPMAFKLGISAPTLRAKGSRPNPIASSDLDYAESLTLSDFAAGNEGGAYTGTMRAALGYARQPVSFAARAESLGGVVETEEIEFSNPETWTRRPSNWDDPGTPLVEKPPPPWDTPAWEASHGYPWQTPRVRYNYMADAYDATGELDFLGRDWRRWGGFSILNAFIVDTVYDVVVASSLFRAPVMLRPGLSLYVRYRARIRDVSRVFAARFAERAFGNAADAYDAIYARPLLASAGTPLASWTWSNIASYFSAELIPILLDDWTFVPYAPTPPNPIEITPHVESDTVPVWINEGTDVIGNIAWIVVYGEIGGDLEPMWYAPVSPTVTLAENDRLRAPNGLRFWLKGI